MNKWCRLRTVHLKEGLQPETDINATEKRSAEKWDLI